MGTWVYVKDEEEIAEESLSLVYNGQLEEIDDSQSTPDNSLWREEGDPTNEDDCVLNGWELPS